MISNYKKKKGFTLIELLAVIAISAIVGTVIVSLFISSQKTFTTANSENIIQDEGRMIVEMLENDIRIGKKKAIEELPSNLGKIKVDGEILTCSFANGKKVTPIYAGKLKDVDGNEQVYVYMKVEKKLIKGQVVQSGATKSINKLGVLTENLESCIIKSIDPYRIEFKLQLNGMSNDYSIVIKPRNS